MSWFQERDDGVVLNVRVVPRASRNQVDGVLGDALKIRITAPPVEGKANKVLLRFLAKTIGLPPGKISILSGEKGRGKRVLLAGIDMASLRQRLSLQGDSTEGI